MIQRIQNIAITAAKASLAHLSKDVSAGDGNIADKTTAVVAERKTGKLPICFNGCAYFWLLEFSLAAIRTTFSVNGDFNIAAFAN